MGIHIYIWQYGLSTGIAMPDAHIVAHAPKQQRSRETLQRLLDATIHVLERRGLEGALIPEIAAAAQVAPASVYRRFKDKDALLRAAFLHALERSQQANREQLPPLLVRGTLVTTAMRLSALALGQYRHHPQLLRAMARFIEAEPHGEFAREARARMAHNVELITELLLPFRAEIAHRSPRRALRFALLTLFGTAEAYALEAGSLWHTAPRISAKEFATELARAFVAYLRNPLR